MDDWGSGLTLRREDFASAMDEVPPEDRFALRQDVIHRLNTALADADTEASDTLAQWRAAEPGDAPDFSSQMHELLRQRRMTALGAFADPTDRNEAEQGFDGLTRRYMRSALDMDLDARVKSRALGAEKALGRIMAAAVADPDRLPDRLSEADLLLGRMVEAGVDANAAAQRAGQFRVQTGAAILDDLAERDPFGGIARLDAGLFDIVIGPDDKAQIREDLLRIAEADTQAERRRAIDSELEAGFAAAARRRSNAGALSRALQKGEADEGTIARAFYRGEIDADDMNDLRSRLDLFDEDRRRRAEEIDFLDRAVKSGVLMSPPALWSQDAVDSWWLRERERDSESMLVSDCFGVTGRIPRPYVDDVRRRILSGLPDDEVAAGQMFHRIQLASEPAAELILRALPDGEARSLSALADYADIGLPAARVAELAAERVAQAYNTKEGRGGTQSDGNVPSKLVGAIDPPTTEPVDLQEWYGKLGYSDEGKSEIGNLPDISVSPSKLWNLWQLRDEALERAERVKQENDLTIMEKDAFRHAYWSYKLSEMVGIEAAKKIGDAHERMSLQMERGRYLQEDDSKQNRGFRGKQLNPRGEKLMDLYNNHIGRQIYEETSGKTDVDIDRLILDALQSGRLQREPFQSTEPIDEGRKADKDRQDQRVAVMRHHTIAEKCIGCTIYFGAIRTVEDGIVGIDKFRIKRNEQHRDQQPGDPDTVAKQTRSTRLGVRLAVGKGRRDENTKKQDHARERRDHHNGRNPTSLNHAESDQAGADQQENAENQGREDWSFSHLPT